jgi:diguanylate cyclase (GGDEF)-like protein
VETIVLQEQPLLLNNLSPDDPVYRELKLEHDFTSAVLAPVIRDQRGVGYIFCDRAGNGAFTDADLLHIQVIGLLIGSLIEKFDLIKASKRLSITDDATGALHFRAFIPAMATEIERARTHGYSLAFALLSVDAFRGYVETYGINEAHALLAGVVAVARTHVRAVDILARFSADEFILCLSGVTEEEARATLEAVQADVAKQIAGRAEGSIAVTIGILPLRTAEDLRLNAQDIISLLGKSLVKAKAAGVGQVAVGTTAM